MTTCEKHVEQRRRRLHLCCYGARGCTLAPSARGTISSTESSSVGSDPKQEPVSEPNSRSLGLELSNDATLQDCYLLAQALSAGGFDVSVTVQATPPSALSPLDIHELSIFLTAGYSLTESLTYLAARMKFLRSTTRSSKRSD